MHMHGHPAALSAWGLIALLALQAAKQIQCSLEYTTLKRITQTTEIYYDPDPMVCLLPICLANTRAPTLRIPAMRLCSVNNNLDGGNCKFHFSLGFGIAAAWMPLLLP